MSGDNTRLRRAFTRSQRDASRYARFIQNDLSRAFAGLPRVVGLATGAIAGLSAVMINNTNVQVRLARSANQSFEAFQAQAFGLRQAGIDSQRYRDALQRTAEIVRDANAGSENYVNALRRIGLSSRQLSGLTLDRSFQRIAVALRNVENATTRTGIVRLLFPETGRDIEPFIQQSRAISELTERYQRLGGVITNETGQAVERLSRQFSLITNVLRSQFTEGVVGAISQLTDGVNESDVDAVIVAIGNSFRRFGEFVVVATQAVFANRDSLIALGTAIAGASLALRALNFVSVVAGFVQLTAATFAATRAFFAFGQGVIVATGATVLQAGALQTLFASAIPAVITAVAALIARFSALFVLVGAVTSLIVEFGNSFANLRQFITGFVTSLPNLLVATNNIANQVLTQFVLIIGQAADAVRFAFGDAIDAVRNTFVDFVNDARDSLEALSGGTIRLPTLQRAPERERTPSILTATAELNLAALQAQQEQTFNNLRDNLLDFNEGLNGLVNNVANAVTQGLDFITARDFRERLNADLEAIRQAIADFANQPIEIPEPPSPPDFSATIAATTDLTELLEMRVPAAIEEISRRAEELDNVSATAFSDFITQDLQVPVFLDPPLDEAQRFFRALNDGTAQFTGSEEALRAFNARMRGVFNEGTLFEFDSMAFTNNLERTLVTSLTLGDFSSVGTAFLNAIQAELISQLVGNVFDAIDFGAIFGGIFHDGGVVPGFPGQNVPILAQAGEIVLTRDQFNQLGNNNAGGIIVNYNVTGDVLDATRRALYSSGPQIAAIVQSEISERRDL